MNDLKLIIVDPDTIKVYKNYLKQNNWQWSFVGTDPRLRESIINLLGRENRHCYAKEFQNLCLEQKKDFLDWIAKVGNTQDNIIWCATNMAYKSPYASDIFINYCFLTLIQKWINQKVSKRIIIVENPWLIKACAINFNNEHVDVINKWKYFIQNWVKKKFCCYARQILFPVRAIRIFVVNKIYALACRKQIKSILKNKMSIDILTCTWIEDRSFKGENNHFHDPYLGNLSDYYSKMGLKVFSIAMPFLPIRLFKKVYSSKKIIPSSYFVKLPDILKLFFKSLFFRWRKNIPISNGLDLTPLINYEMLIEKGNLCYVLFHYLIWLKLFKDPEMSCLALIYPFENQPWDKMMILAKRQTKNKCRAIGYQHTTIPHLDLKYFLGKNERDACAQPDIIVSNGQYWEVVLKNAGFICPIKNGGSLRFTQNMKADKEESLPISDDQKRNVLVLLSTSLVYSLDLLYYLLRSSINDKKFLLKPHPDVPENIIKKYIKELPDNFSFISGSMDECIKQVGWAIHIGTTAAIECMMKGITVFKYLPERIDMDPLLGIDFKQRVVTDGDILDFKDEIVYELPDSSLIAEPFNEETWKTILV